MILCKAIPAIHSALHTKPNIVKNEGKQLNLYRKETLHSPSADADPCYPYLLPISVYPSTLSDAADTPF